MMEYSIDLGLSEYWMLHSPTMPRWRTTLVAVSRSMWYSSLERVCEGEMTTESPVCTPMGSKFSMLHTVMQLSAASRTTSYSTSFQPNILLSTRICGATDSALAAIDLRCASSLQIPEPRPPRAKALRIITGNPPISLAAFTESSTVSTAIETAIFSSISLSLFANNSRSSVAMTTSIGVPSTVTPYFSKMPLRYISTAQLRAVWPPMLTRMPSGFSRLMTSSTKSGFTGRKNTWSADCVASPPVLVCTEAMFGFIRITCLPSSFNALIA
mmetsp:Transcript_12334/g.25098  ORF Transcript_12334/g.25098 Transcript_12334/m.25098 type:complete len:270 (+) Transcript_12334:2656-3465(+)